MNSLFSELRIKNHAIKNRLVMPPMVCFGWTDNNGMVTENNIKHYEERAKGGTGLIIVEATCVSKDGRLADTQLGIWCDEQIDGLSKLAEACHKHDSKVIIQIHHAGLSTPAKVRVPALAPSDFKDEKRNAVEMTVEELKNIQKEFVQAAIRAEKAGFDGIEIHGAHGYLICQFFSKIVNKRKDEYGGSLENRGRFVKEIIDEIKKNVSENFIIGYRMGGNEPTLEEGIEIAKFLEKLGVDLLHVSAGMSGGNIPEVRENFKYNWIVYMGTEIKKHVNIPVIVVNSIKTPQDAEYIVENGLADFVAIGRGHLVDKQWSDKAKDGQEVKQCLKCKKCLWWVDGNLCPQNKEV